ncbi:MAG TPA: TIGR03560 family F420-dependent LLM class oxidoreductase [Actinomycetes bacterium]|nr:TIGR03560 family F420-dependent LLM class oxidoreductase [Actinomycetes bacterium]
MELGLHVVRFDWPESFGSIADGLAAIGRTAEDAGITHLSVMDHYFQISGVGPPEDPMLEGYLAALHLAHATNRARVGVLATGAQYRYPGLLIKIVTTLDVLSGGRALCILGAGWNEEESLGLGVPMPARGDRFARLEDTLRLAHQMFADDPSPFHGSTLTASRPLNHPIPLSRPRPPIMVGGGGEQRTLRLVAQYADACNVFFSGETLDERAATVRHKFDVLRAHCADLGRPYEEIRRTALTGLPMGAGMGVAEVLETCRVAADAGVQELIVMVDAVHDLRHLETLGAEVVPVIATW